MTIGLIVNWEDIANEYLQILNNPKNTSISNPNIHYHVKNNYSSQKIGRIVTLMHKEKSSNNWKPVALKERLYYIITEKHLAVGHGGARATYKQVSDKYYAIRPIISKFFMQWLQSRILTDKCAAKVAVFLFDIFTVFGLLIFLQSDNG
ncbi:29929_t:CDS:2, partial [Racocetra persica]